MRNVWDFRRVGLVIVCLGFTGAGVARADPAHPDWVEDAYAPHVTRGTTARLGTAVGFIYGERREVLGLGMTTAVGQRFDRFTVEAEYGFLHFQGRENPDLGLGSGHRLGVIGRFDVLRLGPHVVGGNSMLAAYVEGGAAVAWNHWFSSDYNEVSRLIPADSKRPEAQVGFGILLDHRLQEPTGFPHRIGWFLGWRMAFAPHDSEPAAICKGVSCRPAPMMPEARYTDRSMLFQSSMAVTW
jgi:hypothetical protein